MLHRLLRYALLGVLSAGLAVGVAAGRAAPRVHDIVIRHGMLYDGSGAPPVAGEVAIDGDRIVFVGRHAPGHGTVEIDARGKAVAPGFINMLAHPEESLFADGRAQSDLRQGVTLEVLGEDSMGPLNPAMQELLAKRQSDIHYPVNWSTLGEYLDMLERRGIAPNLASTVGAATVRTFVLGEGDVQPTPEQLATMRRLVRQAMEQGAVGLSTALIYSPGSYATTAEVAALATEAGACGGIYLSHLRSEGDRLLEGVEELIEIARESQAPAEIYHLKAAGRPNWGKLDALIARVAQANAEGIRITADMYTYTAGATGLDAAMPPWVQDGGLEAWIEHLKDPAVRARVLADMRDTAPAWENLEQRAGADGTLLLAFKNPALKPLTGRTLAAVAAERGVSPEDAAIDLVIEDGTRVGVAYFLMSEDNVRRETALPWVSFGSDEAAPAPEGVFLASNPHPRAYGNFARLLGKYVRDEHALPLAEAIRKLTSLPASNLSLTDRGRLKPGYVADLVVFDPATIADHATYERPHQFATGVSEVVVNGRLALKDGEPTGAATGRVVRGRAFTGRPGGGCRASSRDWRWSR
ncbi:MAG TPA: D-aminoacylase [Steroidobacteraceae bacterium]|nr:D-aminoacylase [Steroidobacteraceae bacterium]